MLSVQDKKKISEKIQEILHEIKDSELPEGEIKFLLHVDGKEAWSWANIRNFSDRNTDVPISLIRNISVE